MKEDKVTIITQHDEANDSHVTSVGPVFFV
jgi:hypothetical protein